MAEDRNAVELRDVHRVAGTVLRDATRLRQAAVSALQARHRRPEAGSGEELERRQHATVDAPLGDVKAPALIDVDVRIGEDTPDQLLLAHQQDLTDGRR